MQFVCSHLRLVQCPSTSQCYHILAVKMSIGLEDLKSRRRINLTQLRRNTRSKVDKKSGRKAPRPGDYEIIPAPDASATTLVHVGAWIIFYCSYTPCEVNNSVDGLSLCMSIHLYNMSVYLSVYLWLSLFPCIFSNSLALYEPDMFSSTSEPKCFISNEPDAWRLWYNPSTRC